MKLAIPCNSPGGLEAVRADHFGHCDVFTLVSLGPDRKIEQVETLANHGHQTGGCMAPVKVLYDARVEAIVVGGLGARPMQGFNQVGIEVYFAGPQVAPDVRSLVQLFVDGQLPKMQPAEICKGSGNCHH